MTFKSWRRWFPPAISIVALLFLSYVLGAAVVRFRWPTSQYLLDAFEGAQAWSEHQKELAASADSSTVNSPTLNNVDIPERTFDGFTLYTTGVDSEARLINMRGQLIHRWSAPFRTIWPRPTHLRDVVPEDKIHLFDCHLYPNGDLLMVYHGTGETPYGFGLAKLDKNSNVIWKYSANVHHAVDVGPDGTVYVLTQHLVHELPKGLEFLPCPALVDNLVLLSPDGKELKSIPLLEALLDSPYAALLRPGAYESEHGWDVLHTNSIEVLRPEIASKFPQFRPGQVLISVRELDALAMVDPEKGSIVWAARGPWQSQHDPHFLDNGHILVFDNHGANKFARVLEYDPQSQACPWCYPGPQSPKFTSSIQGRCQRLPNGNTLVVNSERGVIMEITKDMDLVWSCGCHVHVPYAHRYAPEQLTFLKGAHNVRP